jgi:hypothetical protein
LNPRSTDRVIGHHVSSAHYHLDRARKWLVDLYEAWGKPKKAAEWRAKPPGH